MHALDAPYAVFMRAMRSMSEDKKPNKLFVLTSRLRPSMRLRIIKVDTPPRESLVGAYSSIFAL